MYTYTHTRLYTYTYREAHTYEHEKRARKPLAAKGIHVLKARKTHDDAILRRLFHVIAHGWRYRILFHWYAILPHCSGILYHLDGFVSHSYGFLPHWCGILPHWYGMLPHWYGILHDRLYGGFNGAWA